MPMSSIRARLARLEDQRRFQIWVLHHRFVDMLTCEELKTLAAGGDYPDPLLNRPSRLDKMDPTSLLKLWEENKRIFRGRNMNEIEFFNDNGFWPEEGKRLHYFTQDGNLLVAWQDEPIRDSA